jgi:hypothetical protein
MARLRRQGLEMGVAYNDSGHTGSSMGSDAKDYDNDGNVDIFYNNLAGQVWQLLRNNGDLFQFPFGSKIQTSEPAICGLEHWIHRLQQRRMEGHLLGQWGCRRSEPEVAAT